MKRDLLFYQGDLKTVKACAGCEGTVNRKVLCLRNIYIILDGKGTEITINNYYYYWNTNYITITIYTAVPFFKERDDVSKKFVTLSL